MCRTQSHFLTLLMLSLIYEFSTVMLSLADTLSPVDLCFFTLVVHVICLVTTVREGFDASVRASSVLAA